MSEEFTIYQMCDRANAPYNHGRAVVVEFEPASRFLKAQPAGICFAILGAEPCDFAEQVIHPAQGAHAAERIQGFVGHNTEIWSGEKCKWMIFQG